MKWFCKLPLPLPRPFPRPRPALGQFFTQWPLRPQPKHSLLLITTTTLNTQKKVDLNLFYHFSNSTNYKFMRRTLSRAAHSPIVPWTTLPESRSTLSLYAASSEHNLISLCRDVQHPSEEKCAAEVSALLHLL